ncbi:MAG: radical SAM protein [candidate division KSB1 bacterium]|nr:radical SAM protein [candidate division KSB1 bacterium]MDZ7302828.1 radical SAM protein [candidate division KSB1 bacterium]MDZ7311845.1 radical SAM protein [candidate division KSB1 bacterium]
MSLPSYLALHATGELARRAQQLKAILADCTLCPRRCRANRLQGEIGVCRSTAEVIISSAGPHFGEEAELVGLGGSGTIFFTNCNLWCLFCQNYEISHLKMGQPVSIEELARRMLNLQSRGCHNINLVTPTHYVPQIVEALCLAAERGLQIPIVYNCGGYESVETLRLLEGIVDIYMPDIKYSNDAHARRYSGVKDYWEQVRPAVKEMYRQVGDLKVNHYGIAERGLLIRHLVLPNDLAGSEAVFRFIAEEISRDSYVNIMDQYRPAFKAHRIPELARRISSQEYHRAIRLAQELGLHRGF